MHELALIQKIIQNCEAAAEKAHLKTVRTVRMRIGKMAGFEPGQLQFLFETYEKSPSFADTKLEVEEVPVELECPECKLLFSDDRFNDHDFAHTISHAPLAYEPPSCPKCKADGPDLVHGKELDLVDLEGE